MTNDNFNDYLVNVSIRHPSGTPEGKPSIERLRDNGMDSKVHPTLLFSPDVKDGKIHVGISIVGPHEMAADIVDGIVNEVKGRTDALQRTGSLTDTTRVTCTDVSRGDGQNGPGLTLTGQSLPEICVAIARAEKEGRLLISPMGDYSSLMTALGRSLVEAGKPAGKTGGLGK